MRVHGARPASNGEAFQVFVNDEDQPQYLPVAFNALVSAFASGIK